MRRGGVNSEGKPGPTSPSGPGLEIPGQWGLAKARADIASSSSAGPRSSPRCDAAGLVRSTGLPAIPRGPAGQPVQSDAVHRPTVPPRARPIQSAGSAGR